LTKEEIILELSKKSNLCFGSKTYNAKADFSIEVPSSGSEIMLRKTPTKI